MCVGGQRSPTVSAIALSTDSGRQRFIMTRKFSLQTEESDEDETMLMNMQIPWCREVFYEHFSTLARFRQAVILQGKLLRRRIGKDVLQQLEPHPREAFRAAIEEEGARSQDMQWFLDDLSCERLHGERLLAEGGLVFLGNLLWMFSWRVRIAYAPYAVYNPS